MCLMEKELDQSLKAVGEDFGDYVVYSEQTKNLYALLKEYDFIPQIALIPSIITRDLEKVLIHELKEVNVTVITPSDTWDYFRSRFSPLNKESGIADFFYLPDYVFVVNAYAKERAICEGVPEEKIIVTGNPHFEYLGMAYQQNKINQNVKQLKQEWKIKPDHNIIIFASEGLSQLLLQNSHEYPGYNEVEVLKVVSETLKKFSNPIFLLITIHPYEDPTTFLQQPFLKNIQHRICKNLNPLSAIKLADIVIGMRSMFLIEAAFLGKRTISYQPISASNDQYFGNVSGITNPCYEPDVLENKIAQFLENQGKQVISLMQPQNATQNVIELLDRFSTSHSQNL